MVARRQDRAHFYREPNRRQGYLLPVDMTDWVSDTDMVHLILEAIERMDWSAFEKPSGTRGVCPIDDGVVIDLRLCQRRVFKP